MKKSIAFIGALFMGSIAFAQVSKNDNTNKTASRKVLDADVKDLPTDPDANVKTGEIKGEYHQKMKGEESNYLKVSDNNARGIKGSVTQKGNIESETAAEKKHVGNVKWTPGKAVKDTASQGEKRVEFLKIAPNKQNK
jgi:hypothetical protein